MPESTHHVAHSSLHERLSRVRKTREHKFHVGRFLLGAIVTLLVGGGIIFMIYTA